MTKQNGILTDGPIPAIDGGLRRMSVAGLIGIAAAALGVCSPVPAQTVITPDQVATGILLNGTIASRGKTDTYTFAGKRGDIVTIDMYRGHDYDRYGNIIGTYAPRVTLLDPSGMAAATGAGDTSAAIQSLKLQEFGSYTIDCSFNDVTTTGSYDVSLSLIPPSPLLAPDRPAPLPPDDGATVSATPVFRLMASDPTDLPIHFELTLTQGTDQRTYDTGLTASGSELDFSIPDSLPPGAWKWRAWAINSQDVYGPGSVARTFTIPASAPPPLTGPPVAIDGSAATSPGTPAAVTLLATSPGGLTLSYSVVDKPAHGAVTGSGAAVMYTPAAGYAGTDSFTFKANDGMLDSNVATINISINIVGYAPVLAQTVIPPDQLAKGVLLKGTIAARGKTDTYAFAGKREDIVTIDMYRGHDYDRYGNIIGTHYPRVNLLDPFGAIAASGAGDTSAAIQSFKLEEFGTYTIECSFADVTTGGTYDVSASLIPAPVPVNPPPVRILAPDDGAALSSMPVFRLMASDPGGLPLHFELVLTPVRGGADRTYETGTTDSGKELDFTLPASLPPVPWTWRVWAVNANGLYSPGSATRAFTVSDKLVMLGDLNNDGMVNLQDATLALQIAVNLVPATNAQNTAGDVNGDGKVNLKDVTLILQYAVGLIKAFPKPGA